MNEEIKKSLCKRLTVAKGLWAEEMSSILWAYRTIPKRSTVETPFGLAFGAEAIVPVKTMNPSDLGGPPGSTLNPIEIP